MRRRARSTAGPGFASRAIRGAPASGIGGLREFTRLQHQPVWPCGVTAHAMGLDQGASAHQRSAAARQDAEPHFVAGSLVLTSSPFGEPVITAQSPILSL